MHGVATGGASSNSMSHYATRSSTEVSSPPPPPLDPSPYSALPPPPQRDRFDSRFESQPGTPGSSNTPKGSLSNTPNGVLAHSFSGAPQSPGGLSQGGMSNASYFSDAAMSVLSPAAAGAQAEVALWISDTQTDGAWFTGRFVPSRRL